MTGQASEEVLALAGGAYRASLNHYNTGGNCMVTTVQVDEQVYVVAQDDFAVGRYPLAEWLDETEQDAEPDLIECDAAEQALELLNLVRQDALVWQCGGCDAWIHTTPPAPQVGVLRCSTCGSGGVDFHHAWRHLGTEDG